MSSTVLYLHGLESGPLAAKALALRDAGFTVHAPALDTVPAATLVSTGSVDPAAWRAALQSPVAQAVAALAANPPDVIVGSSFGAAVLLELLHAGHGVGVPVVMLAGAGVRLTTHRALPPGVRAVLVHGREDTVVPPADSRLLADASPDAVLVEVHDDHRLSKTTASGLLAALVTMALSRR
jgi:dienelactone hydrolase